MARDRDNWHNVDDDEDREATPWTSRVLGFTAPVSFLLTYPVPGLQKLDRASFQTPFFHVLVKYSLSLTHKRYSGSLCSDRGGERPCRTLSNVTTVILAEPATPNTLSFGHRKVVFIKCWPWENNLLPKAQPQVPRSHSQLSMTLVKTCR